MRKYTANESPRQRQGARLAADMESVQCKFPQCQQQAILEVGPQGEEGIALCAEHRQLLLEDVDEFRRLWGAIDPRP